MTKLLIADDHPIVLNGIEAVLRGTDFEIIARCSTGTEVLEALHENEPDMLILDIRMPGRGGLEVVRNLQPATLRAKVILLTASLEDEEASEAIALGVGGLVLKETAPHQLLDALRQVRRGGRWIDPETLWRALERKAKDPHEQIEKLLTRRELQIVRLVERGLRNKDIGRELLVTEGTVKMHLHNIYNKLGVDGRAELAIFTRDRGAI